MIDLGISFQLRKKQGRSCIVCLGSLSDGRPCWPLRTPRAMCHSSLFISLTLNTVLTMLVTENWIWLSPVIISALRHTSIVSLAAYSYAAFPSFLLNGSANARSWLLSHLPRYHLAATEARGLCREISVLNTSDYCAP